MTPEKVIQLIKSEKWQIQGFSAYPFYLSAAANPSAWEVNKYFGKGYRHFLYLFEHGHTQMFYDEADWDTVFGLYENEIKTVGKLRELEREAKRRCAKAEKATKYKPEDLPKYSLEKLTELALAVAWRIGFAVGLGHIIEGLEFGAERVIERVIETRGVTDKATASRLFAAEKPSFAFMVQEALWEIKQAKWKDKRKKVRGFLNKWGWSENTYLGSAHLTYEAVLKRAEALAAKPVFPKDAVALKKKLCQTLGLSSKEKMLVEAVAFCTNWHDERKAKILQSIEIGEPVMEEIARRVGVKREVLLYSVMEELSAKRLRDPKYLALLKRRFNGCALYSTPDKVWFFESGDYLKIKQAADALHETENITELKGTVAQGGFARGTVRVCRHARDIASFPAGAILVAPMTRPEYVPAMQKASAIITDEGGITSHAAIIARELGKPCIIGTRIATKVFKDGDTVEVDADRGIVKVLGK